MSVKHISRVIAAATCSAFLLVAAPVAAQYGDGVYGGGQYGRTQSSTTTPTSPSSTSTTEPESSTPATETPTSNQPVDTSKPSDATAVTHDTYQNKRWSLLLNFGSISLILLAILLVFFVRRRRSS